MTAEPDLLPLPEPFAWVNPDEAEDFIDGEDHHFTAFRRGVPDGDFPIYSAEQVRACVSSATATQAAEIEALRAEVERANRWNESVSVCRDHVADIVDGICVICALAAAEARAERLAEALREAADDLERGIDARIVVAQLRAAQHPTAAQEDGQ